MLTLTLSVTQKHDFSIHQINTPFIYHNPFSSKFSYAKKKYGAMLKKETHEALKIAKEKKKKNGTHEGSKVLKKRDT
jgi:hypothetical protein